MNDDLRFPPRSGYFTPERVEYAKNLLQLLVLSLALPWVLKMAFTAPGQLVRHAGRAQVGG